MAGKRLIFWNAPDVFTKEKRSEVMSHIRGKGNKDTELVMIQILRSSHISGWRRNQAVLGKPDFVFYPLRPSGTSPKSQRAGFRGVALFVDGCFWHGCPKHSNMPRNNRAFWAKKLQGNKDRDKFVARELRKMGWKVVRVWEHELKYPEKVVAKLNKAFGWKSA